MTERKDNDTNSQITSENTDLTAGRYAYDRLDRVLVADVDDAGLRWTPGRKIPQAVD